MAQLSIKQVSKTYRQLQAQSGSYAFIKNLISPQYKEVKALDDINFDIKKGERLALLGQNGAGKSTLVKIICGALSPSQGEVLLDGKEIDRHSNDFKKRLGIIFGQRTQLWWELPIDESLSALKTIYEVSDQTYKTMLDLFDQLTGMAHLRKIPAKNLSLGQRTLCEILASCIHMPDILILDEPTIGLDLDIKDKVRVLINELNRTFKITVILTSHDTADIENICDRIVLINSGKVIFDNSLQEFINEHGIYFSLNLTAKHLLNTSDIRVKLNKRGIIDFIGNPSNQKNCEIIFNKTLIEPMQMIDDVKSMIELEQFHIQSSTLESAIKYAYRKNAS
jgi:ABC-2 type transport system ATP-binding protein